MALLEIGALAAADRAVDLGPEHPSRAGLVRFHVSTDGGGPQALITRVDIQPGLMHRGAEKLFEVRDYRQVLMLADRHDWQAPFVGELGVALTCERLLGLVPPTRATVLRTLLAEVARLQSHLGYLTFVPFHQRCPEVAALVREARDRGRDLMMIWTGNRLHPMINRLGGLASDVGPEWFRALDEWLALLDRVTNRMAGLMDEDSWQSAAGIAPVDGDIARRYGLSGPTVRAAGILLDLRTTTTMLDYAQIGADEVLAVNPDAQANAQQQRGTASDRFRQWLVELAQSAQLVRRSSMRAREVTGPVNVPLSKIIKLPDAEEWMEFEAPLGVAGFHLVSRGGTTPWRLKLRTPSFAQVNALHTLLVGVPLDRVALVVASMGYTVGDLDK
ncbi:NADH-quinone oxidoreductase subunit D-related protein [Aestuariimicrobium sp. T2.26MG-19.2B]|uniref:NADH-quinone oxidoreductase subunit D-related protein n=1 Tax=Aestuariimicrobium sp. T2.26MG-19.2B TaxID=3040679 RepID=UPI0024776BBB|nr:NADH-quinone oxidoreductase subunit D [Aestuariimicrobium sp. T2.26MG-19.2B]CAI9404996.1 NADH-quinone oxidoreductase subunit D [Aestuariimicrobium sp. T2.26MG-19.2B]